MSKRFKGKEVTYSYADTDCRVRMYKSADGNVEKVVIISGKKNIVVKPEEIAIATLFFRDNQAAIVTSTKGYIIDDPVAERIRMDVLPIIASKVDVYYPGGGWKIPAIKLYREITRLSLKESKEAVEFLDSFGFEAWMKNIWIPYKSRASWLSEISETV